ncbi:unnamed protein product (macronuclear) [Paramecium tetraurelia]|uniref:Uncharacterized protein n=1 Tax=Paramecium tetraurelia TaxID=5888 RepID=A0BHC4_PARTE|nr:uncharacterized protein GSPATT00028976001 [Paramecium tetraurelia]CAK57941.1 unnamed protein product [Paramecium tetraurelia]|eukprot:XP_001425339.1 hypothetical protein (macronuclear) [Paramecium tetraurelia strain d4-2]
MFTLKLRLKQIVFQLRLSPVDEIIIRKQILLYVYCIIYKVIVYDKKFQTCGNEGIRIDKESQGGGAENGKEY